MMSRRRRKRRKRRRMTLGRARTHTNGTMEGKGPIQMQDGEEVVVEGEEGEGGRGQACCRGS